MDPEVFLRHRPGPFFCRKCFRAYRNLMTAMKVSLLSEYESVRHTSTTFKALESNMEMAVSAMITAPSLIHPPRNILGKRSSTDSHPSTTKRICVTSCK